MKGDNLIWIPELERYYDRHAGQGMRQFFTREEVESWNKELTPEEKELDQVVANVEGGFTNKFAAAFLYKISKAEPFIKIIEAKKDDLRGSS